MSGFSRADIIGSLLLLGFVLFAFGPLLFFGHILSGEEFMDHYYVMSHFFANALNTHTSLDWIDSYYGGSPVAFDQFASIFFPPLWLVFRYIPAFLAHNIVVAAFVYIGIIASYYFGRRAGMSAAASSVLGVCYCLAVPLQWMMIGTQVPAAFMVQPLLFIAILGIHERRNILLHVAVGTGAVAIGFIAGFAQMVFYFLFLALLFAVYLDSRSIGPWYIRFRSTLLVMAFSALGMVLALPQILTTSVFISGSIRGASYAAQATNPVGLEQFISFLRFDRHAIEK